MSRYDLRGKPFKIFVREQNGNDFSETQKEKPHMKLLPVQPLTGDKAKSFYEELLKEPSSAKKPKKTLVLKPKIKKQTKPVFKDVNLLRMAQNNEVNDLEMLLSSNEKYNINIIDDFGWTPLMCASCSGAEDSVKILLEYGADPNIQDKYGSTALSLARKKNQKTIVQLLENYCNTVPENREENVESTEPFFCTQCQESFTIKKKKHETSTLHLFNCKLKTPTYYGIPESNKGFQLLLREGWDKERGLGPDGSGRKFPIKASMKKDRSGIGVKVTENKSNNKKRVHTTVYENKQLRKYFKEREKNFEKNFRLEFS